MEGLLAWSDVERLREALLAEEARRSNQRTFSAFVKQAWRFVPSVDPLVWGWHIDAICSHLEEVAHGRMPKLVVNCPPGHAKSVLLAVLWPAWIWTWWPECQLLFASYSGDYVVRDSVRCRAVISSDWYQQTFARPAGWGLRGDQNVKSWFMNTRGGERRSTSVGGAGAGLRAHVIGIDDPLNISDAQSKPARDEANEFIGATLSQRFVDARSPRMAMIMQRLHEEDPTGFVLAGGGWEHLRLPSEFEPDERSRTFHLVERRNGHVERVREPFFEDPRREPGELLFPERFPQEVLEAAKQPNALGPDGFAGQHQQRPRLAGGGMFKVECWRFWKPDGAAPDHVGARPKGCYQGAARPLPSRWDRLLISVDASFKETTSGSFVAMHVWGAHGADRYLLDRVHARMDFDATVRAFTGLCARWPKARERLIEDKANGPAIVSALKHRISGIIEVQPEGGKEARAAATQPYQAAGNVYLPDGAPWLSEYIDEHAAFPKGKHNDDVDAQSQALVFLEGDGPSTAERWARAQM